MSINAKKWIKVYACLLLTGATLFSCKHDPSHTTSGGSSGIDPASTQYPLEIAKIITSKCAVAGCHNEASYTGAGNLRLDDWQYMFEGSSNGSVIVPYAPDNSSLLYFINPPQSEGAQEGKHDPIYVLPTMPVNGDELTKEEYDKIKQWIVEGAPDKNGNIPFGSNADGRQKFYLTQQGCDLIGVIDGATGLTMRYISIGGSESIGESPHFVKFDNEGKYAYVCFINGTLIQKIDVATDKIVGEVDLTPVGGGLDHNVVQVSPDGKTLITSQLSGSGRLTLINTDDMTIIRAIAILNNPHGIAFNPTFDTFYVTGQYGNTVFKVPVSGQVERLSIDENPPIATSENNATSTPNPHEVMMTPDYSKYFLTCENTSEVRVMDRLGDSLLKAIPVGSVPKELAVSKVKPYIFVTCQEDQSQLSNLYRGSVYVINYNTLEIVKRIDGAFAQPHGIAVDDRNETFCVASINDDSDGPAPHHVSGCGGRNGYYQIFDLNTLEPKEQRRHEVTRYPYSLDSRFK